MGIFGFDYLLEEDIDIPDDTDESFTLADNEDSEQENEPSESDTQDKDENADDQPKDNDDTTDDQPQDNEEDETMDDEDDDFTLDSDGEEDEDTDDSTNDDSDDDNTSSDDQGEPGADDDIKDMENEVMEDLSDEQKFIRDKELKTLYVDLYNSISNILMKVDRVVKTTNNIRTLNYCETRLSKIQDMVYDYLLDVYKTKSYIQNLTMYYMILGTLSGIDQLLKSLTTPINK